MSRRISSRVRAEFVAVRREMSAQIAGPPPHGGRISFGRAGAWGSDQRAWAPI